MPVIDDLRHAIAKAVESGQTYYRIAKEAGVDWRVVSEFAEGGRQDIRATTVEKLCEYLDLELRPRKQATKKRGTARKQAWKNP